MPIGVYKRKLPGHRKGVKASKETRLKQSISQKKVNQRKSKELCVICKKEKRASINGRALYCLKCRKIEYRKLHSKGTRKWHKKKLKEDMRYRLRKYFSLNINKQLKRRFIHKARRITIQYLPYTIDELIQHLQSKFKKGMTWKNYGKWHIDHIIPESFFSYKDLGDREFQKCWALENLQPLWAKENRKKSNKLL